MMDEGAWIFGGVIVTQLTVVFGMIYQGHQARKAKLIAASTNNAVNHVAEGEPTMINQVREHGKILQRIQRHQDWSVGVLQEVARQSGVRVPPLPADDEEAA
jgi:acyl-coenzyme A thioesterase PaaI-like protein